MVKHGTGSILSEVKIKRTKCTGLVKNVIAPAIKSDLIEDCTGKKFSIVVEESTDTSVQSICAF